MSSSREQIDSGVASSKDREFAITASVVSDLMSNLDLTFEQAAGVAGNLLKESANFQAMQEFNPDVKGSRGGLGWAQWTASRRESFEKWAFEQGLPTSSYAANMGYLIAELTGKIPELSSKQYGTLDKLREAKTVAQSAEIFLRDFETPKTIRDEEKNPAAAKREVANRVRQATEVANRNSLKGFIANNMNTPNTPATLGGNKTPGSLPTFQNELGTYNTRQIQQHLSDIGFYNGPVNGNPSKATVSALRDYQRSMGLPTKPDKNGIANFETAFAMFSPTARQTEIRSMNALGRLQDFWARENISFPPGKAARDFAQRLKEDLSVYQPGKGGTTRGRFDVPVGRLPADPKQPAMPGGPIGRLPADPNRPAMPGGPIPGQIPAERLARSPITGQRARLSEIASMQALQNYRNEPRIVATPPERAVGSIPAERLARSPIIGQMARASEIKSLSDLAGMTRQANEQRAGLASMGRASENASMASLASMQGAGASRRADLASAGRAAENKSMADLASMDRKVAENRALYAPFARAAENKSMADLSAMNRGNAMGQASQARASENASMAALGQMRAPTITGRPDAPMGFVSRVEGRPQGAIGSLPISPTVGATNFGPGPTGTREASRWNATTGLMTRADQRIADLQRGPSAAPTSDFRQTPASRLADAYGVMGKSRAAAEMPSARMDPRAAAVTQGFVSGWGGKPQTGSTMPMDAVMAPRQIQTAPAAVPAVPPSAPATISAASPQGSRLAAGYAGYAAARGYPMGATLQPAPQPAAPLQQRAAPAPVVTQPQRQITNEPQFSGRTPGDRARSSAFQPGGIFGYTSQQARGGGGYNPTPV